MSIKIILQFIIEFQIIEKEMMLKNAFSLDVLLLVIFHSIACDIF